MELKKKKVLVLIFILLGLLGLTLGLSIASFLLLLNLDPRNFADHKTLSIITYFSMLLFVLILIITIFIYLKNIDILKTKVETKGETDEKE